MTMMMSMNAIRLGAYQGKANGRYVTVPGGVEVRVWHLRESARRAALEFGSVSTHNRRVESIRVDADLAETI